jgi:hypothetical protein
MKPVSSTSPMNIGASFKRFRVIPTQADDVLNPL